MTRHLRGILPYEVSGNIPHRVISGYSGAHSKVADIKATRTMIFSEAIPLDLVPHTPASMIRKLETGSIGLMGLHYKRVNPPSGTPFSISSHNNYILIVRHDTTTTHS